MGSSYTHSPEKLKVAFISLGDLTLNDFTGLHTNIPKLIHNLKIKGNFEENKSAFEKCQNELLTGPAKGLSRSPL